MNSMLTNPGSVKLRIPHTIMRGARAVCIFPAAALLLSLPACSAKPPAQSSREVSGTQPERVAAVSKLIATHSPLPGPLTDAHFLEQQVGDGILGPSEFASFYALTVAPADLAAWRSTLTPLCLPQNMPAKYAAPNKPAAWWLTQEEFSKLKFYEPKSVTGRVNGWVGIAPDSGNIYVYSFTM